MPVPFREHEDPGGRTKAAFLRVIPDHASGTLFGALLVINEIGEPVELAYAQLDPLDRVLCADARVFPHAARMLALALFENCASTPDVLLFREQEVTTDLFEQRIHLGIPAASVSGDGTARWIEGVPPPPQVEHMLERLRERSLIAEPFERAGHALRTVLSTEHA